MWKVIRKTINSHNVGYRWRCLKCKERNITKIYEGETGRSARIRGLEHVKDLQKKRKNSVLFKHIASDHSNENVKFKLEITGKFQDALSRQANEAVRIHTLSSSELLNSKSEFNHPPLARVVVERKTPFGVSKKKSTEWCKQVNLQNFTLVQNWVSIYDQMALFFRSNTVNRRLMSWKRYVKIADVPKVACNKNFYSNCIMIYIAF